MKRSLCIALWALLSCVVRAENNPQAVVDLAGRVLGDAAASHFTFVLDESFNSGSEAFQLGADNGTIVVTANTLSAMTVGLNWYLNHEAHVNITWNNLRETPSSYPMPVDRTVHTTDARYRYYLNYCTFSYSMSFWDEERWMQEIDWMALHGVNLPLQVVGLDAVWYQMLTKEFGFTHDEANTFIAGPAFQGWWLMNNLIGHGGPNPDWWYEFHANLGKKIIARMVALGMTPCIPGFVGMAPQKYVSSKGCTSYSGSWCGFTSPLLMASGEAFNEMAEQYYKYVKSVFGYEPKAYSMDPVHERNLPSGMGQSGYASLCDAARNAMNTYGYDGALWVAQMWQVNADQHRIDALPSDNTLLLDLASERVTYAARFGSHPYLFCMLHNYGGNIGLYGCIEQMLNNYRMHRNGRYAGVLQGVGATPEGIETNPVLYELLFELPWLASVPDAKAWIDEYSVCRYGVDSEKAKQAWRKLLATVYNDNQTNQQGCREPVFCSRPNLTGEDASSWAGADFDWDKTEIIDAANLLLSVDANNANYIYDLVDVVRQALSDHGNTLQLEMLRVKFAEGYQSAEFKALCDSFLVLIDDVDRLLGTVEDFRLGRWIAPARNISTVHGTGTNAEKNWLEWNARMLITTWGNTDAATNRGGLRDYANREYQGLMTDYYKPRWVQYFKNLQSNGDSQTNWFDNVEIPFITSTTVNASIYDATAVAPYGKYTAAAEGDAKAIASELVNKYFSRIINQKWREPGQTSQGLQETAEEYHVYVTKITYKNLTKGTPAKTIYTSNTDPTSLFCLVEGAIEAEAGEQIQVTWNGSNGYMNYCYLSAYLDTDSDGTFDSLLCTKGTYQAQNTAVQNGSFSFTVPNGLTESTRLRMRFDGAWNTGFDTSTNAFPAQNVANRMVYDIIVNVPSGGGTVNVSSTSRVADAPNVYNLSGQKVTRPNMRGVYVIDGNKVVMTGK